jgi:5-enolpyruvylshikimate-3-phosphate synthase
MQDTAPVPLRDLLTRIRHTARTTDPDHAERILGALRARVADGSLAEATPTMSCALAQADDDLNLGRAATALLGVAYMASVCLEVEQAGA